MVMRHPKYNPFLNFEYNTKMVNEAIGGVFTSTLLSNVHRKIFLNLCKFV
jgi:hypothetical protein